MAKKQADNRSVKERVNDMKLTLFGFLLMAPEKEVPEIAKAFEKFCQTQNVVGWRKLKKKEAVALARRWNKKYDECMPLYGTPGMDPGTTRPVAKSCPRRKK